MQPATVVLTAAVAGGAGLAALGATVVTIAVIAVLSRRRRKRRAASGDGPRGRNGGSRVRDVVDVSLVVAGCALAGGTLWLGLRLLRVQDAPALRSRPGAIGVVPPVVGKVDRGFVLALAVQVKNCDSPARVTLAAGGSAEYWQDRGGQVPPKSQLLIALRNSRVSHLSVYEGQHPEDVTGPLASFYGASLTRLAGPPPVRRFDATVLRASTPDWGTSQYAVLATFDAKWLYPRGLGTCYLALPSLVGTSTILAAEAGLGNASWDPGHAFGSSYTLTDDFSTLTVPLVPALDVSLGNTTVAVNHGEVQTALSLPPPNALFDGYPKWACQSSSEQVQPLPATGPVPPLAARTANATPVYSLAGAARQAQGDCSGIVVVAEDGAESVRDLVLLIMGSLISLGAAVAVEVMLDWREFGVPFGHSHDAG